jgi:hypothetical protein
LFKLVKNRLVIRQAILALLVLLALMPLEFINPSSVVRHVSIDGLQVHELTEQEPCPAPCRVMFSSVHPTRLSQVGLTRQVPALILTISPSTADAVALVRTVVMSPEQFTFLVIAQEFFAQPKRVKNNINEKSIIVLV